tara:strand:+ start:218 stop:553 length:336 start_codon:yes stop_codon:yes gene_type:complete
MSIFRDSLKSLTDESFTFDVGIPQTESEYYSRVKIVKADGELTSEGLPDWELVKNKQAELQADYDSKQYQRDRKREYPSIEELVVALYDEEDKQAIIEKRNAVKAKYPKPE